MQTNHEDKSGLRRLSAAARALFDRQTANLPLSDDEANDVGRQVALAAEERSRPRWWPGMQAAAAPTADEADELARCMAAYDAAHLKREAARRVVAEAERQVFADPRRDINAIAAVQAVLVAAEGRFTIACAEVEHAELPLRRARAAILANGARRQRAALPGL